MFSHEQFPVSRLLDAKRASISVCLPARDEETTIGPILRALLPLVEAGLIDQLAVVDHSSDETATIARALGVEVYDQRELMRELGPVRGKGDAMWRALPILRGDLICFLDADSREVGPHYVCGLLGPLLCERHLSFVKGFYSRPFSLGEVTLPNEGGRVTELMARPLLALFYPELASVRQPLAGEVAASRSLLERLPFVTGYGVDIALLIDAYHAVGLEAIAQVDLDVRQNDHQPLRDLGPMASAVLEAVLSRVQRDGTLRGAMFGEPVERPAIADLRAAA